MSFTGDIAPHTNVCQARKKLVERSMRYSLDKAGPLCALALIFAALAHPAFVRAGQEIREAAPPVEPPYEAGRGLLTLQGPSGMFINPTSATLPQGKFTLQYCNFYPENNTEIVTHGFMA